MSPRWATDTGTVTVGVGGEFYGANYSTTSYSRIALPALSSLTTATLFVLFRPEVTLNNYYGPFELTAGSGLNVNATMRIEVQSANTIFSAWSSAGSRTDHTVVNGFAAGVTYAAAITNGAGGLCGWVGGVPFGSPASQVATLRTPANLFAGANWAANYSGFVPIAALFNTELTEGELKFLATNPFDLVAPIPSRLYFLAPTGGGGTTYTYTGTGGIALAGAATLEKLKVYTATGGITLAGSALLEKLKVYTPSGGVTLTGAATTSYTPAGVTYEYTATGGITLAGAATLEKLKVYTPTGGIAFAGAAALEKLKVYAATGGITLAGAATTAYQPVGATTYTYVGSGGITLAGTGEWAQTKAWTPSGGIAFGGTADVLKIKVFTPTGGITLAGAATTSYVAAGTAVEYPYTGTGGIELGGTATTEFVDAGLAGRLVRRRRYGVRNRIYEADPEEIVEIAEAADVPLEEIKEVTKGPERNRKGDGSPKHEDESGNLFWYPHEIWGRGSKGWEEKFTSPLGEDFFRTIELLKRAENRPKPQQQAVWQQNQQTLLLLLLT